MAWREKVFRAISVVGNVFFLEQQKRVRKTEEKSSKSENSPVKWMERGT